MTQRQGQRQGQRQRQISFHFCTCEKPLLNEIALKLDLVVETGGQKWKNFMVTPLRRKRKKKRERRRMERVRVRGGEIQASKGNCILQLSFPLSDLCFDLFRRHYKIFLHFSVLILYFSPFFFHFFLSFLSLISDVSRQMALVG